jgi:hypothetical protein
VLRGKGVQKIYICQGFQSVPARPSRKGRLEARLSVMKVKKIK